MVELFGLEVKHHTINAKYCLAIALYLYGDSTDSTIYDIIELYKNYPNHLRTAAYNQFNKAMSRLKIKIEYGFAIYQNFWTWNGFYLGLKLQ